MILKLKICQTVTGTIQVCCVIRQFPDLNFWRDFCCSAQLCGGSRDDPTTQQLADGQCWPYYSAKFLFFSPSRFPK